jgi:hypothetical protein
MIVLALILVVLLFGLLEYLFLIPLGGYWETYFFFGLFAVVLSTLVTFILNRKERSYYTTKRVLFGSIVLYIVVAIFIAFINSDIFNANKFRALLPEPKEVIFSKEIEPFDLSKAPIVPEMTALQIADKTISQDGTIGSRAEIDSITLQNIKGNLYYVVPLEHSGFFAWLNNKEIGTPYIMVNANNKECEMVNCSIRYQPGAFFDQDLSRKLFLTNVSYGYTDFTFEVDDDKHPYWTASIYKNSVGLSGRVVTGTAILDAETGDVKIYSVNDTPLWVDRIQPEDIVVDNINMKGKYVRGFSPLNDNDKIQSTGHIGLVFNNDRCYYYSGITSVGKDESSLGFYLVDSRTMETSYFKMSGATETSAIRSAEGKVQNLGYTGAFPIILNVENKATYFIPLQDKNGLTKLFSMVNVEDHTILGTGETVDECKSVYIKALFSKNQLENITGNQLEITGVVKRIGNYTLQGNSYYVMVLDNKDIAFTIPISQSIKLPVTKEGDTVKIKYINSEMDHSIATIDFDNLSVK